MSSFSAHAPALGFLSDFDKALIYAFLRHQFVMRSLLGNTAAIHHKDFVGVLNRGQPVGNCDDGLAVSKGADSLLDQMLVFRVNAGRCLVQNDNGSVFQNRVGDGNPLSLTARERGAIFTDYRPQRPSDAFSDTR